MTDIDAGDVMNRLSGLPPDSAVAALRHQRPDVVRHIQGSDAAIFAPPSDGGLAPAERVAAALRIAELLRDEVLKAHYRQRLAAHAAAGGLATAAQAGGSGRASGRWAAILAHVDRSTTDPASAERTHIDRLLAAGLSPQAVVALSQLIAFVNFQSRVRAGLEMLRDAQ